MTLERTYIAETTCGSLALRRNNGLRLRQMDSSSNFEVVSVHAREAFIVEAVVIETSNRSKRRKAKYTFLEVCEHTKSCMMT